MRVDEQLIDAFRIERRRPPLDAVDDVPLVKKQTRQVGAILPGDASNESYFRCQSIALAYGFDRPRIAENMLALSNLLGWAGELRGLGYFPAWFMAGGPPIVLPPLDQNLRLRKRRENLSV